MADIMDCPAGSAAWRELPIDAGRSVDVFVVRGRADGPTACIVAGIHGDEYEGVAAVRDLAAVLNPESVRGTLMLLPVANPTAFSLGTRTNPEDDLNLARMFPGDPHGGPTQRLAARLFGLAMGADFLIDLHSGGVEFRFLPVAGFYGPPTPMNPSFAAATQFGLDALWQLPPTPGVLSYELHRRGACAIGCEYLGAGQLSPDGRARYCAGIRACLSAWRLLDHHVDPLASSPSSAFTGDWQLAEADGLFDAQVSLGASVEGGCTLATITSMRGAVLQRFVAPVPGTILGLRSKSGIRSGAWGVLLGQPCEVHDA